MDKQHEAKRVHSAAVWLAWALGMMMITGCASMESEQVADMERMLTAAGFEEKLADTPDKKQELAAMPQLELKAHHQDGQRRFTYADMEHCQCLYIGDQAAYQKYQALARQQSKVDRQRQATMWRDSRPVSFTKWGEFGGGGL